MFDTSPMHYPSKDIGMILKFLEILKIFLGKRISKDVNNNHEGKIIIFKNTIFINCEEIYGIIRMEYILLSGGLLIYKKYLIKSYVKSLKYVIKFKKEIV